ncbi:kinetochore protein NDC80 homolog [Telopea speciosissima]|uniref:kinetochore protein NDC80 homolog n=1 Tax=Telopea speciosissima TaxID=54955 RepID=UPI001CC62D3C|nr:kinetochore protein NDC80 homolog [Telopea speciosissima]
MRGGRRRPKDSIPERPSVDPRQFTATTNHRDSRDSDASFCSSRPSFSSSGIGRAASSIPLNDRSYQSNAIRTINTYLSSHSFPFSLRPPLPSAKDITETLRFLCHRLDWPDLNKLEEDLPLLLKHLNCPIKLNKSALKAPGTPHTWPSLLAVIHWLVQIALYKDHVSSSDSITSNFLGDNKLLLYALDSYSLYIRGEDDAVDDLDREFTEKMEQEMNAAAEKVRLMEGEVVNLAAETEALRTAPSASEEREKDKSLLEKDVQKFHTIIEEISNGILLVETALKEKEMELETKVRENHRIREENEELKKSIESQTVNARDVERMKRELQAVERDIAEAEASRSVWEEKSWDLDAALGHKFKELESLAIECNQALRRLKFGNDFQYVLNAKGSTPTEVLGIDYKSNIKPALTSLIDSINKSSVTKLEELISLQQQSVDNDSKLESKRNRLAGLQSRVDEGEAQLNMLKKEIQDCTSRYAVEAKKKVEDIEREMHEMNMVEREAEESLKVSKANLQLAIEQTEEETQMCARELVVLVDSISKYKEYVESKILAMNNDLSDNAKAVADAHKHSLTAQFGTLCDVGLI